MMSLQKRRELIQALAGDLDDLDEYQREIVWIRAELTEAQEETVALRQEREALDDHWRAELERTIHLRGIISDYERLVDELTLDDRRKVDFDRLKRQFTQWLTKE